MQTPSAPQEVRLKNGIPVLLQDYPGKVAATHWFIRTGSADERKHEEGFAHFLEHMLFKDATAKETGIASTGKMARVIEGKGGDLNAYTSFDQTVYHVTCAERHWEEVLGEWGSIAHHQKFLNGDFKREREVILEEIRRGLDSPTQVLYQDLFQKIFGKHPYGRPVIGFPKTLKAAKVQDLEAFFKRRYLPSRMGLVLVGPIGDEGSPRREKLLKILEQNFGASSIAKREAVKEAPRPLIQEFNPNWEWGVKGHSVMSPTLVLGFRAMPPKHPDLPALDLAMSILGTGETSRLYQRLFYKSSIVTEISAFLYSLQDGGMACIQAEMTTIEKAESILKETIQEIERLRDDGPSKEELERVIAHAESERHYATQTADSLAARLGHLRFVIGDMGYDRDFLDAVRETNAQKIRDVMGEYLREDRASGVLLTPKAQEHMDVKPLREFTRTLKGTKIPAVKPDRKRKEKNKDLPEVMELSSGAKLLFLERPHSSVFSVHASVLGGLRLEQADPVESAEKDWGASSLLAMTWTKGTFHRDAKSISEIVEGRAAHLDGFSGRNSIGLQMTGLTKDWDELSGLFSETMFEPMFHEEELEHSKRVQEDGIRSVEDHTSRICSKLFLETLYEHHPYGKFPAGSLESVQGITSAKLRRFHRRWVRPERLVFSVSGRVRKPQLDRWIERLEERFKTMSDSQEPLPPKDLPSEMALHAPRWSERSFKREQLHVLTGGLGVTMRSPDRFALRILQNILGGQGGRLFVELREKKSMAYTVSPMEFEGIERGYLGTYIACAPGKRDQALKGIAEVYHELAKKGPSSAELKRAKEFLLGHLAMELQGDSTLASHYGLQALYGFAPKDAEKNIERIEAVTTAQVKEVCRKYYVEPPMVTTLVG